MKHSQVAVLALGLAGLFSQGFAGSLMDELSSSQKDQLKKGSQVALEEDIAGKPWPRVRIYAVVDARPEEVAAVFFDYNNAKAFVPNVLKSEISNRLNPCTLDVDYQLDVPILPDEFYTARNTIKSLGEESYRVDWKLIRAVQTKDSEGSLRIDPFNEKSVICYQNLVVPGSAMAPLLRGYAVKQMKDTVRAITRQVEKQKKSNPSDLKRQTEALREAFKKSEP